jgi:hypothetical protein
MGLPSGRPAREAFEGRGPGGLKGRGPYRTFKKEWIPFVEGTIFGEASACYLIRCGKIRKVALLETAAVRFDCGLHFLGRAVTYPAPPGIQKNNNQVASARRKLSLSRE